MKVVSVNISLQKGTVKQPVEEINLYEKGVLGDAHSGNWHRMVSLLGTESFRKFEKDAGRQLAYGEFAENITTEGMILYEMAPFDQLHLGDTVLEVTQIGKKCHGSGCAIYNEVGNCVMPKEGIFARVLNGGVVKAGDLITYHPKVFRVMVITLSDRASSGEYEDLSGPEIQKQLIPFFELNRWQVNFEAQLIPDDPEQLKKLLTKAKTEKFDMVFTTGGTGIGPRDFTPEVAKEFLDKEIPGIMEAIRLKYGIEKPNALLSRGVAGLMGETFVYVLPGSLRAIKEYMGEILKTLRHLLFMLNGIDNH
ncbi:MAG: molybdenum cofactor synthesis protein [Bacteroidetes bacterium]|nr:MAG: molybdenum cofactor synthesis protein [Bacteroidota bacterium]